MKATLNDLINAKGVSAPLREAVKALIDHLEAAEKAAAEAYRRGYSTGREEIEAEREALRARIEQMEQQEPVGWFARIDGDGPLMECKHADIPSVPLYALPGAKGE